MSPTPPKPILQPNPSRDIALQALPDFAHVEVFIATTKEKQLVPELRTGTGLKGRVDFGDQTGARRLRIGDCLLVLGTVTRTVKGIEQTEAWIATEITSPKVVELLVPAHFTLPLTDFQRP